MSNPALFWGYALSTLKFSKWHTVCPQISLSKGCDIFDPGELDLIFSDAEVETVQDDNIKVKV